MTRFVMVDGIFESFAINPDWVTHIEDGGVSQKHSRSMVRVWIGNEYGEDSQQSKVMVLGTLPEIVALLNGEG